MSNGNLKTSNHYGCMIYSFWPLTICLCLKLICGTFRQAKILSFLAPPNFFMTKHLLGNSFSLFYSDVFLPENFHLSQWHSVFAFAQMKIFVFFPCPRLCINAYIFHPSRPPYTPCHRKGHGFETQQTWIPPPFLSLAKLAPALLRLIP